MIVRQLNAINGILEEVDQLTEFTSDERAKIRAILKKRFFEALENTPLDFE